MQYSHLNIVTNYMKKFKKHIMPTGSPKGILMALAIIGISIAVLSWFTHFTRDTRSISYSEFLNLVEQDKVKQVYVSGQDLTGELKDGNRFETVIAHNQKNWDILRDHKVDIAVENLANQFTFWHILPIISFLVMIFLAWYFIRQARGSSGAGPSNMFGIGKSKARMFPPSTIKEKFTSVAGAHEAKEELQDVIDFLRSPEKYHRVGAKIPRGVLLVGEPGNGKTLLARAVAGEANCPFFSISGSDFIEVFVGVGASRVRDLFEQARIHAPSIIFIDEIDAVGRHRGRGIGGGHDEREQTLNQLLTEMDGFQTFKKPVIVIAATNRSDVLDKALLRPGRFDRIVNIPFPDQKSREQILRVHAKNIKMDDSIDLHAIAKATPEFSGASLANLLNEAAINASKMGKEKIDIGDIEEAWDKALIGKESKSKMLTEKDKEATAYHEAGHALVGLLIPEHSDPLHKLTIIPRGPALGVTVSLPEREKYGHSKDEFLAQIASTLGGRAAEMLIYNKIMTGASSDFQKATQMARAMVCYYGMSERIGTVVYSQEYENQRPYSEETARLIDEEIRRILDESLTRARKLLEENRDKLELLAKTLLEKETMFASEVYALLGIEPRVQYSVRES